MMRSSIVVLTVAVVAAGLSACTSTGTGIAWPWQSKPSLEEAGTAEVPPDAVPGLAPSSQQRFADVPLPVKVTEDPERTYVFESPTLQIGRLVYTSRAQAAELRDFYLQNTKAGGWVLERAQEAGITQLYFKKPGRRLTVTINDKGLAKGRQLILEYVPDSGTA